ncbi:metallophosphoesterase [Catalinimonas niigatensis]|uniref:metallophosphoesterase n=1 Tax=Catalinimonas niigatensis TaxID=1397264 RepID=UPI0026650126|nr:metallophosphoesterase [Catalinimonas niigatensis]WPP51589.1 metallophosphoesterase [Catalinimonas niigatensis]
MRTFAISDIHGCCRSFESLLQKIGFEKSDELFLLGDYIDRGPASKGVFDLILKLKEENYKVQCLLGNHEEMMLHALHHPASSEAYSWKIWNGGIETLKSFGTGLVKNIDPKYLEFIYSLPRFIEKDRFIFVHAGLNFSIPDPFADEESMLWAFDDRPVVNIPWLSGRIVVHGHRIHPREQIKDDIGRLDTYPILGIDNGCVYQKKRYNHLYAVELHTMELSFQKNIDT